jgi:hypothetical protein
MGLSRLLVYSFLTTKFILLGASIFQNLGFRHFPYKSGQTTVCPYFYLLAKTLQDVKINLYVPGV